MLRQDEQTGGGRGRVFDNDRNRGLVIYKSDFDRGFNHWTDHWTGYRPSTPISLTRQVQHESGSSLMLATTEGPFVAGLRGNGSETFRRMSTFWPETQYRYRSFSGLFARGIGGYNASWDYWEMLIDVQSYDASKRSFFRIQTVAEPSPTYARCRIDRGGGNYITIPGTAGFTTGDNDNKHNWGYYRFTVDMQANGGLGGYHELEISGRRFDLTGLSAGFSAAEPPQFNNTGLLGIESFNGGENIGLSLVRSTVAGGCQLFATDIVYSAHS